MKIAVFAMLLLGATVARVMIHAPRKAEIDQTAITAAEMSDPRMKEIERRFRCPCGNCGHLELEECECDVPGGALDMKSAIADSLSEGLSDEAVVAGIAARFGGLKPLPIENGKPNTIQSHDENERSDTSGKLQVSGEAPFELDEFLQTVSLFDCPCGNCGLALIDCTCDHPRGSVEVKTYIKKKLSEGMTEDEVFQSVAQTYNARRRSPPKTVIDARSILQ